MSDSKRPNGRLVADRRYPPARTAKKKAPQKAARGPRRKPKGNFLTRFVRRLFAWMFGLIWKLTTRVVLAVALVTGLAVAYVASTLPDLSELLDGRARGSVTLLDRDNATFAWRGDQFGGVVTTDTVSVHLRNAVVATEDKRFYNHFGLSPRGIASAVRINLSEGRGPLSGHGGSTITQQTAKLMCLGVEFDATQWDSEADYIADCRRGSMARKIKEAVYALALEVKFSKDEILSIYLNRAYMGGGAYGAEAAAQRYFSKHAAELTPPEAAMLAGLLTAPTRLAPTTNLERSQARAATILRLMREQGYLTAAQEQDYQSNPATLSQGAERQSGGYFADWVMSTGPEFFTDKTSEDVVIRTTLDRRIQAAAESALRDIFATKVRDGSKAQAAIVVMSADGAVRAMVGGRQMNGTGLFNRATQAKRQTGSAFKPFVYATALELGYSPLDLVEDTPYCLNVPGSGEWCPSNYSNDFKGTVTLTDALKWSLNIPAVKVSESVGRGLVHKVAYDFGIVSDLNDTPAMALGTSEASLLEMTGAYAGLLNGGSSVTPYGLIDLRLQGETTPVMGNDTGIGERVINQAAARQLTWMMHKVVTEGTGTRAQLGDRPVAGKTGTSQAARDAWFIGFTADYVAGVWMGYDDNTPLSGVTGSGLPAEIWRETMVRVHEGLPVRALPLQEPVPPARTPEPQQPTRPNRNPQAETVLEQVLRDLFGIRGN